MVTFDVPAELLETPTDPLETLRRFDFTGDMPMWKIGADLDRYATVIKATRPTVIVETGTHKGGSARWFARQPGVQLVYTIDVEPARRQFETDRGHAVIGWITADSTNAEMVRDLASKLNPNDRVMVVLDSAHTAEHVRREIELYAPLVTPGCFLVVEDTIFHWANPEQWQAYGFGDPADGDPLQAVAQSGLYRQRHWVRDLDIEGMHEITHHPAGWWRRTEAS